MKSILNVSSLIVFLIFLSSCGGYDAPENLSPEDFVPIKINNQYQISLPKYMSKTDELNDDASLQFMNGLKEAYAMVIDESKADFEEVIPISYEENGESMTIATFDYYTQVQLESFQESLEMDTEPVRERITINGLNAELCQLSGTIEGIAVKYDIGFYESDNHLYMVMLWTLKSREVHYEETFRTSLKTFKVLN